MDDLSTDWMDEREFAPFFTIQETISRTLTPCTSCEGTGYQSGKVWYRTEMTDTEIIDDGEVRFRPQCSWCDGHGRVITINKTRHLADYDITDTEKLNPDDPTQILFSSETRDQELRHYRNDATMNRKYPDLEAMKYDRYDARLEEYKVMEKLTTEGTHKNV